MARGLYLGDPAQGQALIRPLAALFGLEAAGRLIVGLLPVLMGLSIMSVDWALRRRIGVLRQRSAASVSGRDGSESDIWPPVWGRP